MGETIIDFIRHGEPEGGRAFRGHRIDDPLSEKGWQQMRDAVGEHCPWSHIISSPLLRCKAFAEELANKHQLSITIDDRFKEVGFGDWEGKTPDQLKQKSAEEYAAFYADPVNSRPAGAEELNSFIQRVTAAYKEAITKHSGQHILIVAHAGVIRAALAHVLHAEPIGLYKIIVDNARFSRIRIGQRGAMLERHNFSL
ncbi:MAG: alpha-ribazole phosphatase family protein [Sulfuriflexus sp.]|nr:alpha-ribazole phosphatase family protein [Sulfuriflexus sp.]